MAGASGLWSWGLRASQVALCTVAGGGAGGVPLQHGCAGSPGDVCPHHACLMSEGQKVPRWRLASEMGRVGRSFLCAASSVSASAARVAR